MKNIVKKSDIEEIEMDLTGTCNLRCYICTRNFVHSQHMVKKNIRPMSEIIKQIDSFSGLKRFFIAGTISEPTLHPEFFEFIEHLNKKDITYEIYTNASCHSNDWWEQLGKLVPEKCKTIFTVCGSTQELHEKYRVGSNLNIILDNAAAFREIGRHNDWVQHIRFKYNSEDLALGNMDYIFKQFSHKALIDSNAYNERFNIVDDDGLNIPDNIHDKYINIMNYGLSRMDQQCDLICKSLDTKFISFDQFGNEFPCFLYRINETLPFTHHDYSNIQNNRRKYCFECEKNTKKLLELANIDLIM